MAGEEGLAPLPAAYRRQGGQAVLLLYRQGQQVIDLRPPGQTAGSVDDHGWDPPLIKRSGRRPRPDRKRLRGRMLKSDATEHDVKTQQFGKSVIHEQTIERDMVSEVVPQNHFDQHEQQIKDHHCSAAKRKAVGIKENMNQNCTENQLKNKAEGSCYQYEEFRVQLPIIGRRPVQPIHPIVIGDMMDGWINDQNISEEEKFKKKNKLKQYAGGEDQLFENGAIGRFLGRKIHGFTHLPVLFKRVMF